MKLTMYLPNQLDTPALLQTLQLIANPTHFLDSCAAKYGDTFTLQVLGLNSPPIVFFSHPQGISDCFLIPEKELDFQVATHVFKPLFGDNSLIFQTGRSHQRQRQLLLPPMHGDRLKEYGEVICQITTSVSQYWTSGSTILMQKVMPDITLQIQIMLQVVFGINYGQRYQQLKELLTNLLEDITKPLYSSLFFFPQLQKDFGKWSPWTKFKNRQKEIDDLIYKEIAERRLLNNTDRSDILSLLMSACDENEQQIFIILTIWIVHKCWKDDTL